MASAVITSNLPLASFSGGPAAGNGFANRKCNVITSAAISSLPSFSGRPAAQIFNPRLHSAWNGFPKRKCNVIAMASKGDEENVQEKVPLWRKELTSADDISMEEDIARLQKKREQEKLIESYNNRSEEKKEGEGEGGLKAVIEKVLVADFFFILFILAWLVAGLVERSVLESTTLIDSWLPLWATVFQPALGVFMAGAIVSAVSGYLSKSGAK
jgi:hypothetical protein